MFSCMPRESGFFDLFEQASNYVVEAGLCLKNLMKFFDEPHKQIQHIKDLEHKGDGLMINQFGITTTTPPPTAILSGSRKLKQYLLVALGPEICLNTCGRFHGNSRVRLPNKLGQKRGIHLPDPRSSLKGSSESNKILNLFDNDAEFALPEE